jgi:hypothetical protein
MWAQRSVLAMRGALEVCHGGHKVHAVQARQSCCLLYSFYGGLHAVTPSKRVQQATGEPCSSSSSIWWLSISICRGSYTAASAVVITATVQERTQAGELYCLSEVNGYFDDKEHYNTIK